MRVIDNDQPPISSHRSRKAYYAISHGIHGSTRRKVVIFGRMILTPRSAITARAKNCRSWTHVVAKFIKWIAKVTLIILSKTDYVG